MKIWLIWLMSCIANCSYLKSSPVLTMKRINYQVSNFPNGLLFQILSSCYEAISLKTMFFGSVYFFWFQSEVLLDPPKLDRLLTLIFLSSSFIWEEPYISSSTSFSIGFTVIVQLCQSKSSSFSSIFSRVYSLDFI